MFYEERTTAEGFRQFRTSPDGDWQPLLTVQNVGAMMDRSIAKWQLRAAGNTSDYAVPCPLCAVFAFSISVCKGCPIEAYTGQTNCYDTPFYAAREAKWAMHESQAELDFLLKVKEHYFGPGSADRITYQLIRGGDGQEYAA